MPSAFEAGLRTLFRDPNLSVPAVYTKQGYAPVSLRLRRRTGTGRIAGGVMQFGAQAEHDSVDLLVADVPQRPQKGDLVQFEGQDRTVAAPAAVACNGLVWQLTLQR